MSIFASILRSVYKLSGAKKAFALPEADITCLDYSPDMMRQAREKADRLHLKNVTFPQH